MSKPLFGLNLKKPSTSKPAPPKRKPVFGGNDDSDDDGGMNRGPKVEAFGGDFDDFDTPVAETKQESKRSAKPKSGPPSQPPKLKSKVQPNLMFGDLSSSLTSKKNMEAAASLDPNVYEYDNVYDSLKPKKASAPEDEERRPRYMKNLLRAAEVRKRDALIAEEKKIAREREAEGDEYAGKEAFVTEEYRKQQEENRRIEEEERRREEEEEKKTGGGGMSSFYRNMLNKNEHRHSEVIKAAENALTNGTTTSEQNQQEELDEEKLDAARARELNKQGASIALNEDGQVVDKRQLLRGGLNLGAKKPPAPRVQSSQHQTAANRRNPSMSGAQFGNKQAMRERQSRMLAEQLEQSMKRSREEGDATREEVEKSAKSRKTEGEIMGAKERYLARKKAAEEAKKKAGE